MKWFDELYSKIFFYFYKKKHKSTPKGERTKRYCYRVLTEEDLVPIPVYEEIISETMLMLNMSRIDAAYELYKFLDNLER